MEREYTVVITKEANLEQVEQELTASTGAGPIPNRTVDIANQRKGNTRQTHFMLTDEEARLLENDPRILAVEIPPDQRTDIKIGLKQRQISDFTKTTSIADGDQYVNWGLKRSSIRNNFYGEGTTTQGFYDYAIEGKGVDIVIQDSGVEPNHPEWQNTDGTNRFVDLDWYTAAGGAVAGSMPANHNRDYDGHGTICAGIVAGKTYGYAKQANIYSQKLAGLEGSGDSGTGIPIGDCFDLIREWHNLKPITSTGYKRPTIVNMSWGYSSQLSGDPNSGSYRGGIWVWGADYLNDADLWTNTGIVVPVIGTTRFLPLRIASVDADVDQLISAGVHVAVAAGNDYHKGDNVGGDDYDNYVIYGSSTYYYHRGSSPHSDNAFQCGNIDTSVIENKDRTAGSSSRGPRVDIWAAGTNIVSATSNINDKNDAEYPGDSSYRIAINSGTSFSAPQVAGVGALHLGVKPELTPSQLYNRIIADASDNIIYDTASDTDYTAFTTSLLGASNKMLYNRYAKQALTIKNQINMKNIAPTMQTKDT